MIEPIISVIVCTYNRADLIRGCLESLAVQTLEKQLLEVIVVDNNSTDETGKIAQEFAAEHDNFRVVSEAAQGLSHARNRGWKEARGKYVAYLDDDAKATPGWCEKIVAAFATVEPQPVAVGGEIHPFYETPPPEWFADELEIRTWGGEAGFLVPPRARFGFSGSNMTFQRRILAEHGGFSTALGMHGGKLRLGEDAELFSRIYDRSPYFWYDPAVKVFHWVPQRNMQVRYRFKRAVEAGRATAFMRGQKLSLRSTIRCWGEVLRFALSSVPVIVRAEKRLRKRVAVMKVQQLGGQIGTLLGPCK